MRAWLIPVTEENWNVIKTLNIYGAPPRSPAPKLIGPGDHLIFYIVNKGAKTLGGCIVGIYKVTSTWYTEQKPIWPDEHRQGKTLYQKQTKIEPIKIGKISLKQITQKLTFIKKKQTGIYLLGTPANFRKPIPQQDYQTILEHL